MKERLINQKSIIMVNYNQTGPSAFNAEAQNGSGTLNHTERDYYKVQFTFYQRIFSICIILTCIFGIFGNGMVIWLLGFRIKRNHFKTYVLNLAVADFLLLTAATVIFSFGSLIPFIYLVTFSTSQYLLTVISMDRCVSVFFPFWHRLHRPKHLSAMVCALIWLLSFLPNAVGFIVFQKGISYTVNRSLLIVNGLLCLPLMTISSLMLLIKVCCKTKQQKRRKLLVTVLVTVFFFLLFSFPFNISYPVVSISDQGFIYFFSATLCACLNSSVNPLIYYLVGRPKKGRSSRTMKAILQKLFKEEEI